MTASQRALFLREALEARLDEVEARLPASRPRPTRESPAGDPEEVLRLLMVRLWPRVSRGTATAAERSEFRSSLGSLWEPALSGDLRFLDAWNNAFEGAAEELGEPLLVAYAELLKTHAQRIALVCEAPQLSTRM
jgi:hypothetical protein